MHAKRLQVKEALKMMVSVSLLMFKLMLARPLKPLDLSGSKVNSTS